jgi:hypothetical protein
MLVDLLVNRCFFVLFRTVHRPVEGASLSLLRHLIVSA